MARKRDPKQLLERARQMEEEARRIRGEADRIRREREAEEDRKAGALLRRFWKNGWAGVELADVAAAADGVFGESPERLAGAPSSGDLESKSSPAPSEHSGAKGVALDRPTGVDGELFGMEAKQTDGSR